MLSRVQFFVTTWTAACQAPLSLGFSRQEYWSGLPCPPPLDLPNPGIEPRSPALQANSLPTESPGKPKNTGEPYPLARGSSQPRNWTLVSCTEDRFFTTAELPGSLYSEARLNILDLDLMTSHCLLEKRQSKFFDLPFNTSYSPVSTHLSRFIAHMSLQIQ